jgi:hypothetical protein
LTERPPSIIFKLAMALRRLVSPRAAALAPGLRLVRALSAAAVRAPAAKAARAPAPPALARSHLVALVARRAYSSKCPRPVPGHERRLDHPDN